MLCTVRISFNFLALRLVQQPENIVVTQGSFAWLSCDVDGKSPIHITWYHNGKLVKIHKDPRLEKTLDGKLIFFKIKLTDAGIYSCLASNEIGSVVSKNVTVSIASMY